MMRETHDRQPPSATFTAADGTAIHYRHWPAANVPRAVVQIVHGAAEHSGRYRAFAEYLSAVGYAVYAADNRGHGATRLRSGAPGDAGPDAWNATVDDVARLNGIIGETHPDVARVLFGHSLGSFIAQDYVTRYPYSIDALALSGTAWDAPPPREVIEALDAAAAADPLAPSEAWAARFADYNRPFAEAPGFEWLSRDPEVVAAYERDPLCGFAFSNALVADLTRGMAAMRDPAREANIRTDLPVLVIQGERDPVGADLAGHPRAAGALRRTGPDQRSPSFLCRCPPRGAQRNQPRHSVRGRARLATRRDRMTSIHKEERYGFS